MDRSILEAELKALMEVSLDFSRGLSTVAARMKVLKSCLDKSNDTGGHVSRVDRATSPIVSRTDRSTSVSPLRFRSPVKIKEESVDIHEGTIADSSEEPNYCINEQENRMIVENKENSIECSQKKTTYLFTPKSRERSEEQLMEFRFNGDLMSQDGVSTSDTNKVIAAVPVTSSNLDKSYYVVNPANGLALPIDVSQIKEFGLSKNPIQQITLQHNQQLEEDILYAMQTNQENKSVDTCSTVVTVGQKILVPSDEEPVMSEQTYATRIGPIKRMYNVNRNTNAKMRGSNRIRQANFRDNRRKEKNDQCVKEQSTVKNNVNNLNRILNGQQGDDIDTVTHNVLILRKDLIKKTYARGHRRTETS